MKNEEVVAKAFFFTGFNDMLFTVKYLNTITFNHQKAPKWHSLKENQKGRHSPGLHKIN